MPHKPAQRDDIPIPPTSELFAKAQLIERHPHLFNQGRIDWAVRHRDSNGLAGCIFESRGGELLIHEPGFLRWFLGLNGRSKPRALRR